MFVLFVFSPEYMVKYKEDAEKPMQNCNATHLREGISVIYSYNRCAACNLKQFQSL